MFLEICIPIHSVVFALSPQINKQKYAKTIHLLCAGNKDFCKISSSRGEATPKPPLAFALESWMYLRRRQ